MVRLFWSQARSAADRRAAARNRSLTRSHRAKRPWDAGIWKLYRSASQEPFVKSDAASSSKVQLQVKLNGSWVGCKRITSESIRIVNVRVHSRPDVPIEDIEELSPKPHAPILGDREILQDRDVLVHVSAIPDIRQGPRVAKCKRGWQSKCVDVQVSTRSSIGFIVSTTDIRSDRSSRNAICPLSSKDWNTSTS